MTIVLVEYFILAATSSETLKFSFSFHATTPALTPSTFAPCSTLSSVKKSRRAYIIIQTDAGLIFDLLQCSVT